MPPAYAGRRRGKLVVIAAPSGSGKTTVAREIMKLNPSLAFSVSATTRTVRPGEVEGKDYFFLSREEFKRGIEADEFVEWEELYGNYYGTLKREVDRVLDRGQHLLFDVDVNGGLSIKRQYPDVLMIFIRPRSMEVLRTRLQKRGTESNATMKSRLARVPMEFEKGDGFEHQIVNDVLSQTVEEVQKIVQTHINKE
ncbi:MAG: guanylate kinase [Ignavibacteria bacterium]|nr:guanylate kinase [Ignavibacteria bacterium]